MKTNNIKNYKKSYNSFNPINYSKTNNQKKINGNSSRIIINLRKTFQNNENNLPKKKGINFNLSEIIKHKKKNNINISNNDIIANNNSKHSSKVRRCIKTPIIDPEIPLSRNYQSINKSHATTSQFTLTNDEMNQNDQDKKIEYDLDKLRETGINYCFDQDGNPMSIDDIKTKNKIPIAFIIQTANKNNILMDSNNKIITPNNTGDYILPNKPYIIIHKYDVLHPELRVIKSDDKDNNINEIENILSKMKRVDRRKNNKSVNFSEINIKSLNGLNEMDKNMENEKKNFRLFSSDGRSNFKTFKNLNRNNIKKQKRKYIFVNRLKAFKQSAQLKLENIEDKEENNNNLIRPYFQTNYSTTKDNFFKQKVQFSTINYDDNKNNLIKNENDKLFLNTINGKITTNKIVNDNLEFKFERKYKSYNNTINQDENTNVKDIDETPDRKIETRLSDYLNTIQKNTNYSRIKKKIFCNQKNKNKPELNKYKRQRNSISLNEFMFNPLLNTKNLMKEKDILNNINQSTLTPVSENTNYSTIQKTSNMTGYDKILNNTNNKNLLSNKYYLKPKIKYSNFLHKRFKTENFNSEENIKFLQSIKKTNIINYKSENNYNYTKPFTITEADFNQNNKIYESKCNDSVCKCPYCNNLFYN